MICVILMPSRGTSLQALLRAHVKHLPLPLCSRRLALPQVPYGVAHAVCNACVQLQTTSQRWPAHFLRVTLHVLLGREHSRELLQRAQVV